MTRAKAKIKPKMKKLGKLKLEIDNYTNNDNVLVYQMGKVGSSSLEASLPKSIHLHTLYGDPPCWVHAQQRTRSLRQKLETGFKFYVRRRAIKRRSQVRIVTLVRDPYARDVSMFFQNLPHWMYAYIGDFNGDLRGVDFSFVFNVYEETFDHDYAPQWFDNELKRFTGIDVFAQPFDHLRGWQQYSRGKYEVMLIRLEDLANSLDALSEFVGSEVEVKYENVGDKKWYGDIYKRFKREYIPEGDYLKKVFGSRYARHFYTESELDNFRLKAVPR